MSDGNQRRALSRHQSEEIRVYVETNILFPLVGMEPTTSRVHTHTLVPLRHHWARITYREYFSILMLKFHKKYEVFI